VWFIDGRPADRSLGCDTLRRRLALIDGASHGGSPPVRRPFTLDDCAGAAADVLDHLGIGEPVDWLGNA
jgi:pimeloyl-ACP methyl ester carboxylesterase